MPKPYRLLSAKSFIGKNVNLHLKDGSTIACVKVLYVINHRLTYKTKHRFAPKVSGVALKDVKNIEEKTIYADF